MKQPETKSLLRTAESTISLAELAVAVSIASVGPAAGLATVGAILARHALKFVADRAAERSTQLHSHLIEDATVDLQQTLVDAQFSLEDYYSVLNAAILDDEDAKLRCYATFLRGIILEPLPHTEKLTLLKALRELTFAELQFLRRVYMASRFDFMKAGGPVEQLRSLLKTSEERLAPVETLRRFGFLITTAPNTLNPTRSLSHAARRLFTDDELTPKGIVWTGLNAWLASPTLRERELLLRLERLLASKGIKSDVVSTESAQVERVRLRSRIVILLLDGTPLGNTTRSSLATLASHVVIKLLLPKDVGGYPTDPIPTVASALVLEVADNSPPQELTDYLDTFLATRIRDSRKPT